MTGEPDAAVPFARDKVSGLEMIPVGSPTELDTTVADWRTHGWIHFVGHSPETSIEVLARTKALPQKIATVVAPARAIIDEFFRDIPDHDVRLLFCLTDFEDPATLLRAEVAKRKPYCYSAHLYAHCFPDRHRLGGAFRQFLDRCFVDQDILVGIGALCGRDRTRETRYRRRCQRLGIRSLQAMEDGVFVIRAAYALIECGMTMKEAAVYCNTHFRHLRRRLRKVLGLTVPEVRSLTMYRVMQAALGYVLLPESELARNLPQLALDAHPADLLVAAKGQASRRRTTG